MFDRLFRRSCTLAHHRTGPLYEERLLYLSHLTAQGMARSSLQHAAIYVLAAAESLRLANRPGELISRAEIEQQAALWTNRQPNPHKTTGAGRTDKCFLWHATQFVQLLSRLQPPTATPNPHADLIASFADYSRHERALSPSTIYHQCWAIQHFLDRLSLANGCSLRDLTVSQIDQVLVEAITRGGWTRLSVRSYAERLRAFFRYAEMQGWCRSGLAAAIKSPRVFPQEPLPSGPSWDDVRRLLDLTTGDQPIDIRDRAMLMLLAVYGLRAGEVVYLRLEDFDWKRELLLVTHSKSRQTRTYPLSHSVGDAVLRYLKEVRPRTPHREIFLTCRAPFRPLCRSLWRITATRLRVLGVSLPHCGPHALRHACATHLLEQGLSLKEIGDHLGHRHPDSTRIYTKVNLTGLRQVADFNLGDMS